LRQRQRITHQNIRVRAAHHLLPHLQPFRLKDVTLLAVGIGQQRNPRRAVGIVFNADHGGRNPGLVALEIDNPQLALMTAADEPHGHVAGIAAPAGPRLGLDQRLVRMPRRNVVVDDRRAVAQRLRRRSVCLDCHKNQPLALSR